MTIHCPQCRRQTPFSNEPCSVKRWLNSLTNDKTTDWPNFKAFADDNLNEAKMAKLFFDRVENIAGKGENAGHQHFLLFPQCFQKFTFLGSLKVEIVW